jgi:hypothetical protein
MSHCDEDTLSLLALGESSSPADATHLESCAQCRAELEALRSVVNTVRTELTGVLLREDDGRDLTEGTPVTRMPPPARVWERIVDATGVTTRARPEMVAGGEDVVNGASVASPVVDEAAPIAQSDPPEPEPVTAAPAPAPRLPQQRSMAAHRPARRDTGTLIGIAAVALIIGVLGGFGISTWVQDRSETVASSAVVAQTSLAGLPLAPAAAGDASIVQTTTGRRLDVDVRRLDPAQGFYEVWLINSDVTQMVSVGVLQGAKGDFALPEGIDLRKFPLVDISIQSYQDKGAHSGKSVLRGTLRV